MPDRSTTTRLSPRHLVAGLLLLVAAATGCHAQVATTPKKTPVTTAAKATATPTAAPASGKPTAAPNLLQKPAGDVREVTGVVNLDAAYAVRQAGARVLGGAVALPDALISDAGGNIISDNAAGLIANNGGSLISNNGGGLIANNGAGIISDNAAGVVAPFRLLADDTPAYGTVLPAPGMTLRAEDLGSGEAIALGSDAQDKPVYAVLTDAKGAFHVYLPAGVSQTIAFVATPPKVADDRLITGVLANGTTSQVTADEDTVEAARLMRETVAGILNMDATIDLAALGVGDEFDQLLTGDDLKTHDAVWRRYVTAERNAGLDKAPFEVRARIMEHLAEIVIAHLDLAHVNVERTQSVVPYDGPDEPALPACTAVMSQVRQATAAIMQREAAAGRDPSAYFAAQPYLTTYNLGAKTPLVIAKPADFNDYLIGEYMRANDGGTHDAELELFSLLTGPDFNVPNDQMLRISAGVRGIFLAYVDAVYGADGTVRDAMLAYVTSALAANPAP